MSPTMTESPSYRQEAARAFAAALQDSVKIDVDERLYNSIVKDPTGSFSFPKEEKFHLVNRQGFLAGVRLLWEWRLKGDDETDQLRVQLQVGEAHMMASSSSSSSANVTTESCSDPKSDMFHFSIAAYQVLYQVPEKGFSLDRVLRLLIDLRLMAHKLICENSKVLLQDGRILAEAKTIEDSSDRFYQIGAFSCPNLLECQGLQVALTAQDSFVHIAKISRIRLPGGWVNSFPLHNYKMRASRDQVSLKFPNAGWSLEEGTGNTEQKGIIRDSPSWWAPHVKLSMPMATITLNAYAFGCESMEVNMENVSNGTSRFCIKAGSIELPSVLEIHGLEATGLVEASVADEVGVLEVHVQDTIIMGNKESKTVFSDVYSNIDSNWIGRVEMPHAKIAPFKCTYKMEKANYKAIKGVSDQSISEFEDDEKSTFGRLLRHYADVFLKQIEAREQRIDKATCTASDSAATLAGRALFHSSIATPVGMAASLAALKVKDSVWNVAASGKQSRGANPDDSYKFGDVTRGLVTSVQQTTAQGKVERGAPPEECYRFGDFSRGIASSFRKTSSTREAHEHGDDAAEGEQNEQHKSQSNHTDRKGRYGSVVGSGVGAMAGAVLLGPVGLVAGSFAGSVAGQAYASKSEEEECINEELCDT